MVIIFDNARYHHALLHKAWRAEVMPRFTLDFLPPYSPELNPTEGVWKLTRRLCLHNVYFPKLDQACISAERQFDQWSAGSNALKKLCAITYIRIAEYSLCQRGDSGSDIARVKKTNSVRWVW